MPSPFYTLLPVFMASGNATLSTSPPAWILPSLSLITNLLGRPHPKSTAGCQLLSRAVAILPRQVTLPPVSVLLAPKLQIQCAPL